MLESVRRANVSGSSARVVLRAPEPSDIPSLAEIRRDADMQSMLLVVIDKTEDDDVRAWITKRTRDANCVFFVVGDADNGLPLGYVQIADIHRRDRHGFAGIAIRRSAQGRGVGRAALSSLHRYAKDEGGLDKLMLIVRSDNWPALALYQKAGYRKVGTLKSHFRDREGVAHDVILFEHRLSEA